MPVLLVVVVMVVRVSGLFLFRFTHHQLARVCRTERGCEEHIMRTASIYSNYMALGQSVRIPKFIVKYEFFL